MTPASFDARFRQVPPGSLKTAENCDAPSWTPSPPGYLQATENIGFLLDAKSAPGSPHTPLSGARPLGGLPRTDQPSPEQGAAGQEGGVGRHRAWRADMITSAILGACGVGLLIGVYVLLCLAVEPR